MGNPIETPNMRRTLVPVTEDKIEKVPADPALKKIERARKAAQPHENPDQWHVHEGELADEDERVRRKETA